MKRISTLSQTWGVRALVALGILSVLAPISGAGNLLSGFLPTVKHSGPVRTEVASAAKKTNADETHRSAPMEATHPPEVKKAVETKRRDVVCSLTIDNVSVGECRNDVQTGNQSKVLVAVFVSWVDPPVGQNIEITVDGQTKTINPSVKGCANYVQFILDADGSTQVADAAFTGGTCSAPSTLFNVPAPCEGSAPCAGSTSIGGRVYSDFDSDGTLDASEFGLEGAQIDLFDNNENLICTATSDIQGEWTCSGLTAGQAVRIEISNFPNGYTPSGTGIDNNGGVVQFATVGSDCTVDFGLLDAGNFCENNPYVITPCYVRGDPQGGGTSAMMDVLVAVPYNAEGNTSVNRYLTRNDEAGSMWGVAYQKQTKKLFSSAFLKRHCGWGPGGLGGIYVTDVSTLPAPGVSTTGLTSLYFNLDSYGINTGNEASLTRNLGPNLNTPTYDGQVFDLVGKWGLGDIDLTEDGDSMFIVNLYNRSLVTVVIGNPAVSPVPSGAVSEITIPDPGCSNNSDWRPFALKYKNGKLYVGGVCSAQTSQDADDLQAVIYEYSPAAGTFTEILNIPLGYDKGFVLTGLSHCENWNPWTNDFNDLPAGGIELCYPQPILSDIEFDVYGNMMVAFNDRGGHQMGWYDYGTTPPSTAVWKGNAGGDILRVVNNNGTWLIERNATAGYDNGCGAGNGQGPCNGEFYCQDSYLSAHQEAVHGGIAIHPSNNELLLNMMDATSAFSGGLAWYNNASGVKNRAYRVYFSDNNGDTGLNGKASGLGDVELLCGEAPIEIGNFIWSDTDRDGIQDPGEPALSGVNVALYKAGVQVAATTTNIFGQYKFSGSYIVPNMAYCVAFGTGGQFSNGTLSIGGASYAMSSPNIGFGANPDYNDSDVTPGGNTLPVAIQGLPVVCLVTGSYGDNDNTFDAGFFPVIDYGDLPDNNTAGTYPTDATNGGGEGVGPSHQIIPTLKMGASVDFEDGGQSSALANGDDNNGTPDDENGVTLPMFVAGQSVNVPVVVMNMTGSVAKLTGFFDWNKNGNLLDAGEMFSANVPNGTNGTVNLAVTVPAGAVLNMDLGVRFRLSTNATVSMLPTGAAPDGEVEDYLVQVMAFDFGDLPDNNTAGSYPTNGTNGAGEGIGASHKINGTLKLGASVDFENDGQPSALANGDDNNGADDENGIAAFPTFTAGQPATLSVNAMNMTGSAAVLYAYFDWNKDGDFNDVNEVVNVPVPDGTNGNVSVSVNVPLTAKTNMNLGVRFRLSNDVLAAGTPSGAAPNGEVEDYVVEVLCQTLELSTVVDNPNCFGSTDGSINLTVSGGTGTYTYDWSNDGSETPDNDPMDLVNIGAGNYSVTVTDQNGCDGVTSVVVNQPTVLVPATAVTNVSCNGGTDGAIDLGISGGTPPYVYDWSNDGPENPDTDNQDLAGLTAGSYTVTITDINGCVTTTGATLSQPSAGLNLTASQMNVSCNAGANGSINLTVAGGTSPYTYDWSNDGEEVPDNDNQDISGLTAGLYSVTVTDANGCSDILNVTITEPAPVQLSTAIMDVPCTSGNNGGIMLTVTGGTPGYTYDWSNDGPDAPDNDPKDLTNVPAGTYTVTVTDANLCTAQTSVTVDEPMSGLSLDIAVTNVNCSGAFDLTVGGGTPVYTYDWSNDGPENPDNDAQDVVVTVAGTYSVTVTDANGCTAEASAPYYGCDYGDLADNNTPGSYPTDAINGAGEGVGASHNIVPGIKMGATVDAEAGGASSANANGDDNAGSDDENGVAAFPMFVAGQTVTVSVNVMNMNPDDEAAKLTAYFDWNADGDFSDAGEMVSASVPQGTNGNINLSVPVPIGTSLNTNLGARFRLSTDTDASMSPTGPAPDGEVEDYLIQVMAFDYGDLADNNAAGSYPTDAINGAGEGVGPSHKIIAGLKIGAIVDPEAAGQPSGQANGDDSATSDDEDGVTLPMFLANQSYTVPVVVMNMTGVQAKLTGFFDWNANGSLSDAGEMVSINVPAGTNGTVNLSVSVPIDAVLNTPLGARFRLSSDAAASMNPSGPAPDGEVEDYQIAAVMAYDYGDLPDGNVPGDYPTDGNNSNGEGVGPSHKIVAGLKLGNIVDIDNFGVPSSNATADDAPNYLGQDDEDGVILPVFVAGQTATASVTAMNMTGAPATLYVYFDFNRDGDFADAGETFSVPVPNGTNGTFNVPVSVPVSAKLNTLLGIRFRLTNDPAFSGLATGPANSGEVEDYVAIVFGNDYGDLPDTYGTSGPDAPSHTISPELTLGGCVDNEAGGQPEPMAGAMTGGDDNTPGGTTLGTCAVGSDDENGIVFETPLMPGAEACIRATANNTTGAPAYLQAWIDFNGDGDLLDGGEALSLTGGGVIPNGGVNNQQFCFSVPVGATFQGGQAMVRFRLSSTGGLAPNTGAAANGELEDYKVALAKIGTFVWEDTNGDGIQNEPGTSGINGASVQLEWAGPDNNLATNGDNITFATTTSTMGGFAGQYMFLGLTPGTYRVGLPANPAGGFLPTATNQGGDDELDSDLASGETFVVPVNFNMPLNEDGVGDVPGGTNGFPDVQDNLTFDFGYYEPASVGNHTWIDTNGNGIQDQDENPLPNVPVTLSGTTGSGVPVNQNTTTDGSGFYNFPNLAPGTYKLTFGTPAGSDYVSTDVNQGGNDASDSDADPAMVGMTVFEVLTSGENNTTYDAGFYIPAEIGNYTWIDENADGFQDPGEDPLPGVTVVLDGTTGTGEVVNLTTITDNNGLYLFDGLQPGSYKLTFVTPLGDYVSTLVNAPIANDANDSDADPNMGGMTVFEVLTSGESNLTYDAGYYEAASIGDFVWNDLDADGVQDSNEPGIGGVLVTLTGDDNQGNMIVLTTTTAPDGSYLFDGLVPGDYKLTFGTPSGFDFPSPVNAGGNDATDSDADPTMAGMTTYETLVSGEHNPTYDAGFYECPEITFKNLPVQPVCPGEDIAGIQIFTDPGAATISWAGGSAIGLNNGTAPGPMAEIPAFVATAEGTVTVTVTATLGECTITNTFTITVEDATPPVFANCPNDITVGNDVDVCGANVVYSTPVATDNCATSVTVTQTGLPSGSLFPMGTSTMVFTANDGNGNTSTCDFTITVTDEQTPTAVCEDITIYLDANGNAAIVPADVDGGSTDNCQDDLEYAIDITSFNCDNVGDNNVTLTVTDGADNFSICVSEVTVVDSIRPTFTCPAPVTVDGCDDLVPDVITGITDEADNCGVASISQNPVAGLDFGQTNGNSVVITVTVTDVNGNVATCEVDVIINDDDEPDFLNCPTTMIMIGNDPDQCSGKVNWQPPVAVDDCVPLPISAPGQPAPGTVVQTTGPLPGTAVAITCPPTPSLITYIATDAAGNTSSCTFEVMVVDTEKPEFDADIIMPNDTVVNCHQVPNNCVFHGPNVCTPLTNDDVNDNCTDNEDLEIVYTEQSTQNPNPAVCAHYDYDLTRTWTVTDCAGNQLIHVQEIEVQDTTRPVAVCQNITVTLDKTGKWIITPADINNGSYDNCAAPQYLTYTISQSTFTCANLGDNVVTLTVTDPCGNFSTCQAIVTVVEGIAPCVPEYDVQTSCLDNATTLDNGQFADLITVKALAMQTWTLTANNGGLFTNNSPAPPVAGVVLPVGTLFTAGTDDDIDNDGDGEVDEADEMIYYTLRGRFTECVGYTISVSNSSNFGMGTQATTSTISNKACYPTPYFVNLDGPFCLNTPPFVIEVGEYNNASGTAGNFMVNGVNTNIFDANALGEGFHTVMATFDAGTATQNLVINGVQVGGSMADALADPGCKQKITQIVQVIGTPTTVACNDLINISLDSSCVAIITPDMVLEGSYYCFDDYTVVLTYPAGTTQFTPPNRVDATHINKTISYTLVHIISGNMCWGTVTVEDKLAPKLTCPDDLTLACSEPTNTAYTGTVGIQDCSATTTQIDEEVIDNGECGDPRQIITRTFIVTDTWGNQSLCTQTITVVPFDLADVIMPSDITINCEVANANPSATLPNATGRPSINGAPIGIGGLCSASLGYTDVVLNICEGSYEIYRTWFVANTCLTPGDDNPITHLQRIRINDIGGPAFSCPADITVSVDPFSCCATAALPDVIVSEGCSNITDLEAKVTGVDPNTGNITTFTVPGSLSDFPGNNYWNPDTLAVFPFTQCLPNNNTYTVRYTAADQCGNISSCEFDLTVADLVPPAVSCDEFTQVSLGSDGRIIVNAETFDDGTYDNCCLEGFEVARMIDGPCDQDTIADDFAPTVEFCCADLGDTVTVVFRAYDCTGNTNDCMVQVYVDDKLKPVCNAPANVTVSCENFDPSLWAYGAASATDNCCMDTITTLVILTNFDTTCNKGTITRRFTAVDCAGQTSTCTQRIVVNYEQDYYVRFPNDQIVYECSGDGVYTTPTFFGEDCELLATSFHDEVFNVDPDACFKIERTWEVINWCTHNPNLPLTYVPNPNPNVNSNSPLNLPGPIVSAPGTTGPWAPTVIRINPSDPTTTNFSIFWDANTNGYQYKQIIKVIDNEAPVVSNCPDTLVEVCDLTPNSNQFWNDMAWWDATHQLHDLCEAPTDLSITATDSCTGASVNVRYLLFLDTDNDGDMETVISSTNPPATAGTVNVGNASDPNFAGGVTTSFDQRPVPANQKYRFALQTAISGNSKVATLRWNTNQSPNTYAVPQLPYGTHKIKWIVEDGCGNEKVCEYEFVVKDCKAPTVVCINGLSANIMPTDMIVLWASDFLQYTEDNCTPDDQIKIGIRRKGAGTGFPTNPDGTPQTSVTFTCADLGTQFVELWGQDAAGNADYCETYVIVQDNAGNCSNSNVTVAGELKTEMSEGLQDAEVELNGMHPALPPINMFEQSEINGSYMFGNAMPLAANYTVTPTKDDDHLNGVTTYDLVLINKHILGIESFDSPYKIIASDANNSKSVTTFDIAEIRKLILGIYTELPNNTSWRFVDESYTFPNPDNPFVPAFPESKSVADIQNNALNDDFVSVKVGDVNNTMIANNLMSTDDRTSSVLLFDVQDRTVTRGEAFDVHFNADQFAQGYQFTLNLKGLEVVDIVPGEGMTSGNFAVFSEMLTTSFDAAPGSSAPAEFTLRLRAKTSGDLRSMMNVSSSVTKAEAYGKDAERQSVALRFNGKEVRGVGFEVYQNQPNPWISHTVIGFHLPEADDVTLTVFDESGRQLYRQVGDFGKGYNAFTLDKELVNTTGLLYYQVSTSAESVTMKMIQTK